MADSTTQDTLPATPPNDYDATISDWVLALKLHGHLHPEADVGEHIAVRIPADEYEEVLEQAESQ